MANEITAGPSGLALEAAENRKSSPIGSVQRHYTLDPVLITPEGVCAAVVVVAGARATYVYPGDVNGNIADYDAVAIAPTGTRDGDVLAVMGYHRVGETCSTARFPRPRRV